MSGEMLATIISTAVILAAIRCLSWRMGRPQGMGDDTNHGGQPGTETRAESVRPEMGTTDYGYPGPEGAW